jgi:polar amino acid transport system substrate-binding protein
VRTMRIAAPFAIAGALLLAACGSDSTSASTAPTTAAAVTTAAATTAAGSTAATTAGTTAATTAGTTAGSTGATIAAPTGLVSGGNVTFCTDPEYAPLEYYENGTDGDIIGFDADSSKALAAYWGLKAKFEVVAFEGLMPGLQSKRCDILWSGLYISDARTAVADATPFLKTGPGLIVGTGDASKVTTPDDLSGKTVAVQSGGVNEQILKDLDTKFKAAGKSGLTIQGYPKTAETVAAVTNGKADALIETDVAIPDMVSKSGGKLVAVPNAFPTDTQFGIYTAKGSTLTAAVAAGVKALVADGTLAKLAGTYGLDPTKIVG